MHGALGVWAGARKDPGMQEGQPFLLRFDWNRPPFLCQICLLTEEAFEWINEERERHLVFCRGQIPALGLSYWRKQQEMERIFSKPAVPLSRVMELIKSLATWSTPAMRMERSLQSPPCLQIGSLYFLNVTKQSCVAKTRGILILTHNNGSQLYQVLKFMKNLCLRYLGVSNCLITRVPWGFFWKYRFLSPHSLRMASWWMNLVWRRVLFG